MVDKSVQRIRSGIADRRSSAGLEGQGRTRRGAALAPVIVLAALMVTLFPSAAVSGVITTTLNPTADAYVNQATPTTNYGSALVLNAGATPTMRSYLKFTIPQLNPGTLTATLRVYANTSSSAGFSVSSAGNGWQEPNINWNRQPSRGAITASSGAVSAGTWVAINVTSLVARNATRSFALTGIG